MLITYYEDGSIAPKRVTWSLAVLMGANAILAAGIVFAWTYVSYFVAEPLSWATWKSISRGYGIVGLFEYPFVMLWLMPLLGIFGSWVCLKGGHRTAAYAFVAIPVVMLALVIGWYYLTPTEWH